MTVHKVEIIVCDDTPPAEASGGVPLGGVLSQITTLATTRT